MTSLAGSVWPKRLEQSRKVGGSERKAKRLTRFTADLRFDRAIEGKLAADRRRTRPTTERRQTRRLRRSLFRRRISRRNRVARTDPLVDDVSFSQLDELRTEVQRRDQELLAMSAKMKTLEEQHQDYQRHITVLKESLCAKEEHYNMLQADVSHLSILLPLSRVLTCLQRRLRL